MQTAPGGWAVNLSGGLLLAEPGRNSTRSLRSMQWALSGTRIPGGNVKRSANKLFPRTLLT